MRIRSIWLPLCLLLSACDKKVDPVVPSPTPVPVSPPVVAVCRPFDVTWFIDREMATPFVTLTTTALISQLEVDGLPGIYFARRVTLTRLGARVEATFDSRYRVRGQVNGCWSNWFPFVVGPANPDGSGGIVAAPAPCDINSQTGQCQ